MKIISSAELKEFISTETDLVDTRPTEEFVNGFVRGSINLILNSDFEKRIKHFIKTENYILVCNKNQIEKLDELYKQFPEQILWIYNENEIQEFRIKKDLIIEVDSYELSLDLQHDINAEVIDVRNAFDFEQEHIGGAQNISVFDMTDMARIANLNEHAIYYLHCNGGTRGVLACSILKKNGLHNLRHIQGGIKAVKEEKFVEIKENKAPLN